LFESLHLHEFAIAVCGATAWACRRHPRTGKFYYFLVCDSRSDRARLRIELSWLRTIWLIAGESVGFEPRNASRYALKSGSPFWSKGSTTSPGILSVFIETRR